MKLWLLITTMSLYLISCSIFSSSGETINSSKEVKLYNKNSGYLSKKHILVNLYNRGNYMLLMPLGKIPNYIIFDKDNFSAFAKLYETLNKSKEGEIISHPSLNFVFSVSGSIGPINVIRLLESGDYFIYNVIEKKYVDKVLIIKKSWYGGPLAASVNIWVYIDDFIFWEHHCSA